MRLLNKDSVASVASGFGPYAATGVILDYNEKRNGFYVQNSHTGSSLYLKLGAGASSNNYSMILNPDTAIDAGNGGFYLDTTYVGQVSVSGIFSRYSYFELS